MVIFSTSTSTVDVVLKLKLSKDTYTVTVLLKLLAWFLEDTVYNISATKIRLRYKLDERYLLQNPVTIYTTRKIRFQHFFKNVGLFLEGYKCELTHTFHIRSPCTSLIKI